MKKIILIAHFVLAFVLTGEGQSIQEARKLTNSEQYENATKIYKSLLDQSPNDASLYYYYAMNIFLSDDADSALLIFDKGLSINEANPLIKIGKAKILMERINVREAKTSSEMDGANKELQDRYEQAVANVKEALGLIDEAVLNTKDINVLIEAAEACIRFSNKDLDKAKSLLDKAEAMDSKNIDVKLLFGDMYGELNNGTLAADFYNKAIDLDKTSCRAIVSKGRLYKRSTNYEGAAREFKEAIVIDPSYAPAHRELAETYLKLGKMNEAKEEYKKYLELSNNNCRARIRYATILHADKKYNEALSELNLAQQRCDSNNQSMLRIFSYCYYETRENKANIEKGLITINHLFRELRPERRTAKDYEYYGKLLIASNQDSSGIEQLQKAQALDPSRTDLLSDMANAWINLKQYENAIHLLNQKITIGKDVKVQDFMSLGQAYYFNRQFIEADNAVKKANEMSPNWGKTWLYRAKVNANIDSTSEAGLAKPFYERYIEIAVADSARPALYQNGLIEAYTYLASYYFIVKKDTANALLYLKKKLELPLEPEDKKNVLQNIDQLEGRGPKPKK